MRKINKLFIRSRRPAFLGALTVFVLIVSLCEMYVHNHNDEEKRERFKTNIAYTAKLRAQVESELSSLLYLNSGLGSYLVVRNNNLQPQEVNNILSVLYRSSRHVRNFGIAVGYRIKYIYPRAGNESAIGLYYPDQPKQWPMVKKIIEGGMPALAGPVDLVQGGRGLIYRVPLYINKEYWGLLSTVIDIDSFMEVILGSVDTSLYEFAIRGADGSGVSGNMVWGNPAVFEDAEAALQEIRVPGGSWFVAVRAKEPAALGQVHLFVRMLVYPLALLGAWMMYMLVRSRADLADLAMYDQLTGLPNRHLLEDRAEMAFARQKRKPERMCAILFLDLDGFKEINDRYGHKAGDAILVAVAERASTVVRGNDTVSRWGGDEFIILMEDVEQDGVPPLIERLRKEIEAPIEFEGSLLYVGVSIGMAVYPKTGASLDQMLRAADQEMYNDKLQHKVA